MAIALPAYSFIESLPSAQIVQRTLVAACPPAETQECLAAADLLQAVGSFYEIVIIILIALLAVIASLVYLSIRTASRAQIEEQLEKDLKSEWFGARIQQKVDTASQKRNAEFAQKIEILEQAISSLKSSAPDDEGVVETQVVPREEDVNGAG